MATKKAGGSSRNGRDSNPQYRGVKMYGGQKVVSGNIIVRDKFHVMKSFLGGRWPKIELTASC